jgi:sialate O-acetylesterase
MSKTAKCLLVVAGAVQASVKLPSLISDHMVLQQGVPVRIWGTADAGEAVRVVFQGARRSPPRRARTANGRRG